MLPWIQLIILSSHVIFARKTNKKAKIVEKFTALDSYLCLRRLWLSRAGCVLLQSAFAQTPGLGWDDVQK